MQSSITIRKYKQTDLPEIHRICCKTGYMGRTIKKQAHFSDTALFGYLFCFYYLFYEQEHCFVALDSHQHIIGYIIGTNNTNLQIQRFKVWMIWRIIFRILKVTFWRYPRSVLQLIYFIKASFQMYPHPTILDEFPAHFHINVDPDYQTVGVGSSLLQKFERHMENLGVKGIHLRTNKLNTKAIPFYRKFHYKLIQTLDTTLWGYGKTLVFAKKL